jgi:hypothetical protein
MNKNGETLLEPPCMKCGRLNGAHSLRCSTVNLPRVWRCLMPDYPPITCAYCGSSQHTTANCPGNVP